MKKLTALPSVVIMPDGSEKLLDSFTKEERDEWSKKVCKQIGLAMSEEYANDIAGWNDFARKMMA